MLMEVMTMETKNIMIVGVGGQGSLLASKLLGRLFMNKGYDVKVSEVHGMSQRGGDVQSNLRISTERIWSDLIPKGECDLILSLEPMEALRYLPWLSKGGWIVTNSTPFVNIPNYPPVEEITAELQKIGNVITLDCDEIAKQTGSPRSANMVLLGASAAVLEILDPEKLREGITNVFSRKGGKIVEMNIAAFNAGLEVSKNFSK